MQPVLLGIGAYLVVQFVDRHRSSRAGWRPKTTILLAGRRLGLGLAAFSIYATWFGAETIVGAAGSIYSDGLSGGSADPFGYGLCLIVLGAVIAVPLWRRQYTTFGDLFRERYSLGVERLAILLMIPTSVLWAAAQIRAFGQVVSASSELEVSIAITARGRLRRDLHGGRRPARRRGDRLRARHRGRHRPRRAADRRRAANGGVAGHRALIEPARLALFSTRGSQPARSHRGVGRAGLRLAARGRDAVADPRLPFRATARNATFLGAGLYLGVGLIPVALGLAGPTLVPNLEEPEQVVPLLAQQYLSTFGYVLFAGAVISAILSTVGSCLLAAASLASHNLLVPLLPGLDEAKKVLVRARRSRRIRRARVRHRTLRRRNLRARRDGVGIRQRRHFHRRRIRPLYRISAARAARMRRSLPEWSSGWRASTCSSGRRPTSSPLAARSLRMSGRSVARAN